MGGYVPGGGGVPCFDGRGREMSYGILSAAEQLTGHLQGGGKSGVFLRGVASGRESGFRAGRARQGRSLAAAGRIRGTCCFACRNPPGTNGRRPGPQHWSRPTRCACLHGNPGCPVDQDIRLDADSIE
jgi:hypothetical protein